MDAADAHRLCRGARRRAAGDRPARRCSSASPGAITPSAPALERARQESEEVGTRVLENTGDCIAVLDLEGRFVSMNAEGRRRLGIKRFASYAGTPWAELWKNESAEAARAATEQARRGETARFQGLCPTVAGLPKWWDVVVTAMADGRGKPSRILAVLARHHRGPRGAG